ncbi:MAG: FAD-binding oxidoreductase [Gemmatimonadota bacterium]
MSEGVLESIRRVLGESGTERDASGLPRAVPDSTEAVASVVGLAHERAWRIRIEGSGTWMPADAPADLVLSTRGMNQVISVEPADLVATVEAGATIDTLARSLAERGAWLAIDPPGRPERTLGSVVATATSGPLRDRFGPIRDHVLGCTVVAGDGRVIRAGGTVVKNVAGYDVTKLQVGGFGAFGIITQLNLRLRAAPAADVTVAAFGERDPLTRAARDLAQANLELAACELLSPAVAANASWALVLRLAGTAAGVAAETERVRQTTELAWAEVSAEAAEGFRRNSARAALGGPVTFRLGVLPYGLDEVLDLLAERVDLGLVTAGPARGGLRWSGVASPAALRHLRTTVAQREIPLTIERAPWSIRHELGHFGAYREGIGVMTSRLRQTFDPGGRFQVALEGTGGSP